MVRLPALCALVLLCLPACAHQSGVQAAPIADDMVREEAYAMGTSVSLVVATDDPERAHAAFGQALDAMHRLEVMMTTWMHPGWPKSDIMRLNDAAGTQPVNIEPETMEVLQAAQMMAQQSQGVFDVTMGALSGLWHFDEDLEPSVPDANAVATQRALVNYQDLVLDANAQTAYLRRAGMSVNLGGIAKGYAVDVMARVLHDAGFPNALIQAGGDMLVMGRKQNDLFRVGIRDPRGASPDDYFAMMPVSNHAFSTAGDYERGFDIGEKRYHHILDPRTGYPATACRSVTVFAPSAMLADALDDAIFVLGPDKGMALLDAYPGCGAVVVDADNGVHVSDNLKDSVKVLHHPTHHWHHATRLHLR